MPKEATEAAKRKSLVACSKEVHPARSLVADQAHEFGAVRRPDIEVAVGGEDHAIHTAGDEARPRRVVGEPDALSAVRRSAGAELVDRIQDPLRRRTGSGGKDETGRVRIHDDRDPVSLGQPGGKQRQRSAQQRQLCRSLHGPGYVDEEHEIAHGPRGLGNLPALEPDSDELMALPPGRRAPQNLFVGPAGKAPILDAVPPQRTPSDPTDPVPPPPPTTIASATQGAAR